MSATATAPSGQPGNDPFPGATDQSLVKHVRRGDEAAATHLYERYGRRLTALVKARTSQKLATRIDPDDVVQSVFRTFFLRVRDGHYDVPAGAQLWGLLLTITLTKLRDHENYHLAAKRDARLTVPLDTNATTCTASADGDAVFFQLVIQETLAGLPDLHRTVLELRLAGHEVAEIAANTCRSRRSVERVLQQVRVRLTKLLEEP